MIRTLRATDLLRAILKGASIGPNWAQTWERVGDSPDTTLGPATVARELLLRRKTERCGVWAEGTDLRVLASVRARSGPRVWEVQSLFLSPRAEEEGIDLLERLCVLAGQRGGERVFLRLSTSSPVLEVAKRAGFVPFAQEVLYRLEPRPFASSPPVTFFRPYLPSDEYALFRLYNASAPPGVRLAQGLTFDDWRDAREPPGRWEQQGVYEGHGCLRGWARVVPARRAANRVEMMVHPEEESYLWEKLVAWSLQRGAPERAYLALVPDHQPILALALQKRGFVPMGEYHLMVKSIAVRVSESALAPAGA